MLDDKDRIFTNVYGYQPWTLPAAQARGDWDNTKDILAKGRDAIVDEIIGYAAKARKKLGWKHHVRFEDLVREMVEADCRAMGAPLEPSGSPGPAPRA